VRATVAVHEVSSAPLYRWIFVAITNPFIVADTFAVILSVFGHIIRIRFARDANAAAVYAFSARTVTFVGGGLTATINVCTYISGCGCSPHAATTTIVLAIAIF
jgi:hypothetical protein